MKSNDLKPIWDAYKEQVGEQDRWSEEDLLRLIKNRSAALPWYQAYQHLALNFGVGLFWIGITTGC